MRNLSLQKQVSVFFSMGDLRKVFFWVDLRNLAPKLAPKDVDQWFGALSRPLE